MEEVAETVPLIACSGAVIVPTLNEPVLRLDVEALVAAKFVDVALVEVLFEVVKLEETIAPVVFIVATLSVSVLVVDVGREDVQFVLDEILPRYLEHRFGAMCRKLPHPRSAPRREDHCLHSASIANAW
jgi:hypothetical protein